MPDEAPEADQGQPATDAERVSRLAQALYHLWHLAGLIRIKQSNRDNDLMAGWVDPAVQAELRELVERFPAAADAALKATKGVDPIVRIVKGTAPGEWAMNLRKAISAVKAEVALERTIPFDSNGDRIVELLVSLKAEACDLKMMDLTDMIPPAATPPPTDAHAAALEAAIRDLLQRAPEAWADAPAALSEAGERALALLTAAELVERRIRLRMRMVAHPDAVDVTFTMTGADGLAQALEPALAKSFTLWESAWKAWKDGPTKEAPAFQYERIGPEQWRLTLEGTQARADLEAGQSQHVYDFVLRRGFYDGRRRPMPDGRTRQQGPVSGRGTLERMDVVKADPPAGDAQPVNVQNFRELAEALAGALERRAPNGAPSAAPSAQADAPASTPPAQGGEAPDQGHLSARDLANRFNVSYSALRARLDRLRRKDHSAFKEVADPAAGDAKFLYPLAKVRPIIESLSNREPNPAGGPMRENAHGTRTPKKKR